MLNFILLIQIINFVFSNKIIQEPNIIQFDKYTNLICIFEKNYIFNKELSGWKKNNNETNKYNSFIINNKFILQIKNITEHDKKQNFTCFIDKYSYTFKKLNNLTFLNKKIYYVYDKKIIINFEKIFPIPKCFIKINNESFFPENNIQNKTVNYLYLQVNLTMEIKKIKCHNKIEIICMLMKQNFTILSKNNICISENSKFTSTIFIVLFLILIIFLTIFIFKKI